MSEYLKFKLECKKEIETLGADFNLKKLSNEWMKSVNLLKYSYHFEWLGRPIIQYPQDVVAMQELIWSVKPDLIIETGIAHGGSLIFSASMLALLDMFDAIDKGVTLDPGRSERKVLGIDIDIRSHNKQAIERHPLASRIEMIQGSSIDPEIVSRVRSIASGYKKVLVFLDSNHTHSHVLAELEAYAELSSLDSYCVVFDTVVEDMPKEMFPDRPWGPGDNPKTAVWEYLKSHQEFKIDREMDNKLLLSVAPDGYLRRVSL
jgi:cephalosporin hydroxylase